MPAERIAGRLFQSASIQSWLMLRAGEMLLTSWLSGWRRSWETVISGGKSAFTAPSRKYTAHTWRAMRIFGSSSNSPRIWLVNYRSGNWSEKSGSARHQWHPGVTYLQGRHECLTSRQTPVGEAQNQRQEQPGKGRIQQAIVHLLNQHTDHPSWGLRRSGYILPFPPSHPH